jgi:hypothetical protein
MRKTTGRRRRNRLKNAMRNYGGTNTGPRSLRAYIRDAGAGALRAGAPDAQGGGFGADATTDQLTKLAA